MQARCRALLLSLPLLFIHDGLQAERRELHLSAHQLTRQLATAFPQRRCLMGMACLDLRNPRVSMRQGDGRLFVDVDAVLQALGQHAGTGTARLAGLPRYEVTKGAFFVDQPRLLSWSLPGISAPETQTARQLINGMLADDMFSSQPVWVLDEADPQQAMARLTLRQVQVRDGQLVLTFGDEEPPDEAWDDADEGEGQGMVQGTRPPVSASPSGHAAPSGNTSSQRSSATPSSAQNDSVKR